MLDQMINPVLQKLSQGNEFYEVMMKAWAAKQRGENPGDFLNNLLANDPRVKGLDLSSPYKAAEDLCKQNGKDINQEKAGIMSRINQFLNK